MHYLLNNLNLQSSLRCSTLKNKQNNAAGGTAGKNVSP
jgi:hypothetical protein